MSNVYEARIARARELKAAHPFASDILDCYAQVCAAQDELRCKIEAALASDRHRPGGLRQRLNLDLVLPGVTAALRRVAPASPPPVRAFMEDFLKDRGRSKAALETYVREGGRGVAAQEVREALVCGILVAPYAELLAALDDRPLPAAGTNLCPRCSARPVAGVLRAEGEGGKRFLLCAFCGSEWEFRRIYCAHCGETDEKSLPVFVAQTFPHVRVEACDTCRHCLRTVDLTKDGRAIPLVDDLAAVPLSLWAEESGYRRIHNNLLGT
jgi:formate dehydrogenase maturation protein FdhE